MDACDPDAEIADLRKLIKMNTGESIKLTREQICQVYDDIQDGKLPLPPLVFNSRMGYLYHPRILTFCLARLRNVPTLRKLRARLD